MSIKSILISVQDTNSHNKYM